MIPKPLDFLLLIYLVALTIAPAALMLDIWPTTAARILRLFPFGLLALAMALIVLRTAFPALRIDFGLTGARWASIIALLILLGHTGFALTFLNAAGVISAGGFGLSLGQLLCLAPMGLVFAFVMYAIMFLFLGGAPGPAPRSQPPPA